MNIPRVARSARPASWRGALPGATAYRLVAFALVWTAALVAVGFALAVRPGLADTRVYWEAWHGPLYAGGFVYPPVGAPFFAPAALLPWPAFATLFASALAGSLAWLLWPLSPAFRLPLLVLFLASAAWGNVAPLLAVALVFAVRWPALWALLAWTKATPVLALLGLVRQRRWRALLVAGGTSAVLGALVFLARPDLFAAWIDQLRAHPSVPQFFGWMLPVDVPLWLRLPFAAALAWWAAERWWMVPVVVALATPDLTLATCGILAALPRFRTSSPRRGARS